MVITQAAVDAEVDAARREKFPRGARLTLDDLTPRAANMFSTSCAATNPSRGCPNSAAGSSRAATPHEKC